MKVIFRKNLVTKEYICVKMSSQICKNEVNLQYHVIKYC